ncbi:polysaccharide lyase 8 family protein [Erysipelothrix anatis]|uniref:polysaccharide lyase 8 family protein n=1 Tax=Erysipelothrix anatis TaxID=2683713 RepID=UPI00135C03F0|nr:polysaccharide lyase family 8 super-sandwich domain-containing protein [Erysipelothrix anatis]
MKIKKLMAMVIAILLGVTILQPIPVKAQEQSTGDLDKIVENFEIYLLGNATINNDPMSKNKINDIVKKGDANRPSFDKSQNAVYPGVELDNTGGTEHVVAKLSANLETTYKNLYAVALAYGTEADGNTLYKNPEVYAELVDTMAWIHDKYLKDTDNGYYGNWYSWEIGVPMNLTKILFILRDEIAPEFITDSITMMDAYIRGDEQLGSSLIGDVNLDARQHTGANLTDITFNRIIQGAITGDVKRVDKAVKDMMTVFNTIDPNDLQHGVTDGFYEDGSFIQHSTVAYTGSYGKVLLGRIAQLVTVLNNTQWQDDTLMNTVEEWVYRGFGPVMYEGYMMEIVKGRAVSRTGTGYADGAGVVEALVQLSLGMNDASKSKMQSYVKYLITIPEFKVNTNSFVSVSNIFAYEHIKQDGSIIGVNPIDANSHFAFNLMDKSVHLRDDYAFSLARSSTRVSKYEYMSGENLRSWFQGDGAYYLYQSGVDQTDVYGIDFFATVDHYKLPGTTTVNAERKTMPELYGTDFYLHEPEFTSGSVTQNKYVYFPLGTNEFSGSATLDNLAVSGMQLGDEESYKDRDSLPADFVTYKNAEANKSWFMFDDEIVVLGSNIHDIEGRDMKTTVDNRMYDVNDTLQVDSNKGILSNGSHEGLEWISVASDDSKRDVTYKFYDDNAVSFDVTNRTGKYSDVRNKTTGTADKEITKQYATVMYNHDGSETSSYAYSILPNVNAAAMQTRTNNDAVRILENSENVHAVAHDGLGVEGYVFFEAATSNDVTANNKLIMMRKGNTYGIQDPTQAQATVSFTVNGHFDVASGEATAVINGDTTTVTVNTHNKNGVTQTINLTEVEVVPETVTELVDAATGVRIKFATPQVKEGLELIVSKEAGTYEGLSDVTTYAISLQRDGVDVVLNEAVTVVLPTDGQAKSLKVLGGQDFKDVIAFEVRDQTIQFTANELGNFLVGTIIDPIDPVDPVDPTTPEGPETGPKEEENLPGTGVGNNGLVMIGAVLVVTGALAVILNRRKQMKH